MSIREDEQGVDKIPTMIMPAVNLYIDQASSLFIGVQDSKSIADMSTLLLPAISKQHMRDTETTPQKAVAAESPLDSVRKLVKSSGIYALGSATSPLISLVLAPLVTHNLSLADYGTLTILNTTIALVVGITQLGLGSAFFRAYGYDYTSSKDRRDVLATVNILLCLVSTLTAVAIVLLAPFLATVLLGRSSLSGLVVIAGVVVLLQNLTVTGFAWLRAESRALFFSLLSIGSLLITLVATILLLLVFHLGIAAPLIATGLGSASIVIFMIPITLLQAGIKLRVDIARSLLAFGLPLVLNIVASWVLQLSDRYLLGFFGSLAEVAKYGVAYTLGSAMTIVVIGPFSLAWPVTMFAIAKRDDAAQVFQLVFRWFGMFLLLAAFGLSLVGTVLLDWLFPVTYHSAALIIPVVAESVVFYGIYTVFMVGANIKRKTWLIAVFAAIAAVVNIALNVVLIPLYGAMGAAVSTLIAFIVLALVSYIVNQLMYRIPFEIGLFSVALLVGAALYIGSNFLGRDQTAYAAWSIYACAFILYGGCLVFLGKLPHWHHKGKYQHVVKDTLS